jgi:hypothetical protein
MRRIGWAVFILIVAILCGVPPAVAQFMWDHEKEGGLRGFHGPRSIGGIKRSFQSDPEARTEFHRIVAAIGLSWLTDRIILRASGDTPNAEAGIGKKGERFVFYNADFMQRVKLKTAEHWSLVSILAHEIGHHLALHLEIDGRYHEFELEADHFSGFVLRRLGATLDQAQAAMRMVSPKEPGPIHPGLADRLQAITLGWTGGGMAGPPPGLKDKPPPPPEASPIAPPPASHTRAFGTPDVTFRFGIWHARATRHKSIYFWTGNGDPALEVVLDSNGWWRIRHQSREKSVWSSGDTHVGDLLDNFERRPWLDLPSTPVSISRASYQGSGRSGTTSIDVANDQIRITLTDKGEIRLDARSPKVTFRTNGGRTVSFDEAATAPPPTAEFGTPDVVYSVGIWRIVRTTLGGAGQISFWTGNGDTAVEVVLDSNGWWRVRDRSREQIVWSAGHTSPQNFYERPWQNPGRAAVPISTASYQARGSEGTTFVDVANDQIRITLTDRGEIRFDPRSPRITFRTNGGKTVSFGDVAIAPPVSPPPDSQTPAFGTPDVAFVAGIWRIMRTKTHGAGELYLWTDNGSRAIEVTLDSNGWWRVRENSRERVVFLMGPAEPQQFRHRPWLRTGATFAVSNALSRFQGSDGTTSIDVTSDQIVVTLTDRSKIHVNSRDRGITFTNSFGDRFTF